MNNKQACVFCDSDKNLTREHVLPDWLCDLYPKETMITNQFVGNSSKEWPSKIFQHKARVVCANCNNGWMASLEGKVKPLLTNLVALNPVTLRRYEQDILAFWAQKTLLMLNEAVPGDLKITHDLHQDIYLNKAASKKVLVNLGWRMLNQGTKEHPIASFELKQINTVDVNSKIIDEFVKQKDNGGFVWKAVLALGHVVFEMVGHNMQVSLVANSNSRVFVPIKPYTRDITWPTEWPIEAEGGLTQIKNRA